jgi:OFA family oxalate/formate antiporter-like MFS transporter
LNLLSERITPQVLLCGSISAQAVGMVLLILAPSLGWLMLYVVLYGAAYGAISPLRAAVMAEHMGRRAYGAILAWQGVAVALCSGLGPFLAGWLYEAQYTYTVAFWLCGGVFLLAALSIALTPHPRRERRPSQDLVPAGAKARAQARMKMRPFGPCSVSQKRSD